MEAILQKQKKYWFKSAMSVAAGVPDQGICLAVLLGAEELLVCVPAAPAEHRILPSSLRATPFPPQTWNKRWSHSQSTSQQHSLHYIRLIPPATLFLFNHFFHPQSYLFVVVNARPHSLLAKLVSATLCSTPGAAAALSSLGSLL